MQFLYVLNVFICPYSRLGLRILFLIFIFIFFFVTSQSWKLQLWEWRRRWWPPWGRSWRHMPGPRGSRGIEPRLSEAPKACLIYFRSVFDNLINKEILTKNKRKYVCDCQICEVDICCVSLIFIDFTKCGDFRCIPQIFVIENDNTGCKVSKDPNNEE